MSPVSCYSCLLPPVLHSAANAMIFKLYKVSLLLLFYLFLGFLFCIGVQLINNVVIVSGEQQRDSAVLMKVKVAPSCPALCDPMDCSLPGSSVHGILWARILEWVAISFSRISSQPRDWTWVSRIAGRHFTIWAIRKAHRITKHQTQLMTKTKMTKVQRAIWTWDLGNWDLF